MRQHTTFAISITHDEYGISPTLTTNFAVKFRAIASYQYTLLQTRFCVFWISSSRRRKALGNLNVLGHFNLIERDHILRGPREGRMQKIAI